MIAFENVSVAFTHRGRRLAAVEDVSFTVPAGSIFGIVGSSGAGKSTLLRTVNLLQRPSGGRVLVEGKDITNIAGRRLRELRRQTGMIFQQFHLAASKTVWDNIAFVLKAAGRPRAEVASRVAELLELVGLSEKADAYPAQLSGGQKQRVAIARALANDAKVLLCDEPTSALDPETTASILALLQQLNRDYGLTILIITHELEVVKAVCSQVAVMDQGRLVETGNTYSVFTRPTHPFTKQLVEKTLQMELPPQALGHAGGPVVRLLYQGKAANSPVLSRAAEQYGIRFNILLGKIEYIGEEPLGILYVSLQGEGAAVEQALAYLKKNTAGLEVLAHERARSA